MTAAALPIRAGRAVAAGVGAITVRVDVLTPLAVTFFMLAFHLRAPPSRRHTIGDDIVKKHERCPQPRDGLQGIHFSAGRSCDPSQRDERAEALRPATSRTRGIGSCTHLLGNTALAPRRGWMGSTMANISRLLPLAPLLIALTACGGDQSVASKSAAAYREAIARGTPVGTGHDHGGHGASATGDASAPSADHGAMGHGTTSSGSHAAMGHGTTSSGDHAAMGHGTTSSGGRAGMGHGTSTTPGAHGAHRATTGPTTDHAAMDHGGGAASPSVAHQGHATTPAEGHDQHTATRQQPAVTGTHAGHGQQPSSTAGHAAHGTTAATPPPHDSMQHGAPAAPSVPLSNRLVRSLDPAATLERDRFDAPAPEALAEAAKARAGDHEGHDTRGITPGQDEENPPTPMPAIRTRENSAAPPDHSQHGADEEAPPHHAP